MSCNTRQIEFKLMVLNECAMACKGCFFPKKGNSFNDFAQAIELAVSMREKGYELATCALLPTDIFDNRGNHELFSNPDLVKMLSLFSCVAVGSTLEFGYDPVFMDLLFEKVPNTIVQLQVNLVINRLFEDSYQEAIEDCMEKLYARFGDRIRPNLAINMGFAMSDAERDKIAQMIRKYNHRHFFFELNFSFLHRSEIASAKKSEMMKKGFQVAARFNDVVNVDEEGRESYDEQKLIDKPIFTFVGNPNRIYTCPILPFDEYIFIEREEFRVKGTSYQHFLDAYEEIHKRNQKTFSECDSCYRLRHCVGKAYFAVAEEFGTGCHEIRNPTRLEL